MQRRDGVDLSVRVGLNSGQVVAGEIGSGVSGYDAIGEQVGLAQRMESVAPPGGVILSESTAHLVEHAAILEDTELVRVGWPDNSDPTTLALVVAWTYGLAIAYGVLRADDSAVRASEEAVQTAQRAGNDHAVGLAEYALGAALLYRDAAADRHRGLEIMVQVREFAARAWSLHGPGNRVVGRPGKGQARRPRCCHSGGAQSRRRAAPGRTARVWRLGHRHSGGDAAGAWRRGRPGRSRGGDRPVGEPPADDGSAMRDIWLLRLRALLARARGDDVAYRDLVTRYREMAESLGFEGHIAMAEAM